MQTLFSSFTAMATHMLTDNCAAPSSLSACMRQTIACSMLQTSLCIGMHTLHCIHVLIVANQALVCLVMLAQMLRHWLLRVTCCGKQRVGAWCRIDESGAAEANSSQGLRQRGQRQPDAPLSQAAQAKLKMHGNLQVSHNHVRLAAGDIQPCLTVPHRTHTDAGPSQWWPTGCEWHICAVLCTASCVTCALCITEPSVRKARMHNFNVEDELHSIAAAFGRLVTLPDINCKYCMPVESLHYTRLLWEYGL